MINNNYKNVYYVIHQLNFFTLKNKLSTHFTESKKLDATHILL